MDTFSDASSILAISTIDSAEGIITIPSAESYYTSKGEMVRIEGERAIVVVCCTCRERSGVTVPMLVLRLLLSPKSRGFLGSPVKPRESRRQKQYSILFLDSESVDKASVVGWALLRRGSHIAYDNSAASLPKNALLTGHSHPTGRAFILLFPYSAIILHQRCDELQQRAHDLVEQLFFFDGSEGNLAAL